MMRSLTHYDRTPYFEYVEKIKSNPLAKKVKLSDLKHNGDLSRLDKVDEKAQKRAEKYRRAIKMLEE